MGVFADAAMAWATRSSTVPFSPKGGSAALRARSAILLPRVASDELSRPPPQPTGKTIVRPGDLTGAHSSEENLCESDLWHYGQRIWCPVDAQHEVLDVPEPISKESKRREG